MRGRKSFVLSGDTKGGVVVVRLPPDLHKQFATICQQCNASMNETVVNMIHNYCFPPTPRRKENDE